MLIEKERNLVRWVSEEKIEDFLNQTDFPPFQEILCFHCHQRIRLPIVAKERDVELLKITMQRFDDMLDEICQYVEKQYGRDIRYSLLLEKVQNLLKTFNIQKPS